MKARLALLLALTLIVAACDPGDIELVLDELPSQDLSQSDDPGERTAGASALEILTIKEAEENLDRGIAETDLEAVRQAERLRPDDPRYDFYEAAILAGADQTDPEVMEATARAQLEAGSSFGRAHPELEHGAKGRAAIEQYMNALRDVIRAAPTGEENDRRIQAYCIYINQYYPSSYTERYPQEVSLYLALEADFSICAGR